MICNEDHFTIPPDSTLTVTFFSSFLIGLVYGVYFILNSTNLIQLILGSVILSFVDGIALFAIFVFILFRPIKIQMDEPGVILFYHFRKPVYVTWDMIEWVSRSDLEPTSLMYKINRGGKMKVRFQRYPFFMPFEVAEAIMGAYRGNGKLRIFGRNSIIE